MPRIKATVERRKAKRRLEKIPVLVQRRASRAVLKAAVVIQNHAIFLIRDTPKSGRTYSRGHIASGPGEPPASDTGRLWQSISTRGRGLQAETFTDISYAVWLEFGTARLLPRPFMRPAARAKKRAVTTLISDAVRRAVKDAR